MVAETKLYDALGIKAESSQDEIKKAYRFVYSFFVLFEIPNYEFNLLTHISGKWH